MKWDKKEIDTGLVNDIIEKYACDKLTASILVRRGISEPERLLYMLETDKRHLRNPFELPGMEEAVEKILDVREEEGKVLVFGDRDTDGVTGTALLVRYLRAAGMDVRWHVPVGDEPYGLSMQAVEDFARDYGSLIITVDCGITNYKEIARAGELGLQVIVTDHHEPRGPLPPALAIINPKLKNEAGEYFYPFQGLAGCAIAYKLTQAAGFAQASSLYKEQVCLLGCRPGDNGTWHIDLLKLRNLVKTAFVTETLVVDENAGGKVSIGDTRLPALLEGQHIYTWDAPLQKKILERIFGRGIEFSLCDIAPEAAKWLPATAGKSLPRLKEMSRLGRYQNFPLEELEVLAGIFRAVLQKAEHFFEDADSAPVQLAAIGSIADLMNMEDENRILVRLGIAALNTKAAEGVSDLLYKLNTPAGTLTLDDIAWKLAPAINAAGRMGNAAYAVELLLETGRPRREELAAQVIRMNEERKRLTDKALEISLPAAEKSLPDFSGRLAFAACDKIPRGVTGLTAGRLANHFNLPAIVVSLPAKAAAPAAGVGAGSAAGAGSGSAAGSAAAAGAGSGAAAGSAAAAVITGSIRSSRGYNAQALLSQIADLCVDCGGHEFAAGFSLEQGRWEAFTGRLKNIAYTLEFPDEAETGSAGETGATLAIDAELPLSYLTPSLFTMLDALEPYGKGWPELLFLARRVKILELTLQGKPEAKHVKFLLDAGQHKWPAMYWNAVDKVNVDWTLADSVDIVFKVTRNYFGGNVTPTLYVSDMKRSA